MFCSSTHYKHHVNSRGHGTDESEDIAAEEPTIGILITRKLVEQPKGELEKSSHKERHPEDREKRLLAFTISSDLPEHKGIVPIP